MSDDNLNSAAFSLSGGGGNGQGNSDPSSSVRWLLNNRIMKMNEAEANQEWYKYFVYFKFIFLRLIPRINVDIRKKIESDWWAFHAIIRAIEKSNQNELTKKKNIETLQRNFADSHMFYIYQTLPKVGLDTIIEEGSIEPQKHDFKELERIVRGGNGAETELIRMRNDHIKPEEALQQEELDEAEDGREPTD